MAQLKTTSFSQDGFLYLPVGSTGQRSTNTAGAIRVNSDNNLIEFYDSVGWRPLTGVSKGSIGTGGDQILYATSNTGRGNGVTHIFTSTGGATFTPTFTGTVEVLVIAGGGSGGTHLGGGGGGGGMVYNRTYPVSAGTGIPLSVGAGAPTPSFPNPGITGSNSAFGSITAYGGGGGGDWDSNAAQPGGSGGGACSGSQGSGSNSNNGTNDSRNRNMGGRGVTGQGFPGGSGVRYNNQGQDMHRTGGGGGAGGPGGNAKDDVHSGGIGHGGPGAANDILGYTLYWAGGGGSTAHYGDGQCAAAGGIGGGGGGNIHHNAGSPIGYPSTGTYDGVGGGFAWNAGQSATGQSSGGQAGQNTGSGGGGLAYNYSGSGFNGGAGANGIVIVKY